MPISQLIDRLFESEHLGPYTRKHKQNSKCTVKL